MHGVVITSDEISCNALPLLEAARFEAASATCIALAQLAVPLHEFLPSKKAVAAALPIVEDCAVVGREPGIIGRGLGPAIDASSRIFRTNRFLPALAGRPYSTRDFGSRAADVDLLNTWMLTTNRSKPYLKLQAHNCSYRGRGSLLELYNPAASSFVRDYLACMRRRPRDAAPTWLLHPQVVQSAARLLSEIASASASLGGRRLATHPQTFPTHGFTAVILALGVCREVRLYGFGEPRATWPGQLPTAGETAAGGKSAYGRDAMQPFWADGHALSNEHRALRMLANPDDPLTPPAVRSLLNQYAHTPRVVYGGSSTSHPSPAVEAIRRLGRADGRLATTTAASRTPLSLSTPPPDALCTRLLAQYNAYTPGEPCPPDRHVVEALFHNRACPTPAPRRCRSRAAPAHYVGLHRGEELTAERLDGNIDWPQFEHLHSFGAAQEAATTGRVRSVFEPGDGKPWAAPEFDLRAGLETKKRFLERLSSHVPALRSGGVRTALDVGGGSGRFCSAIRALFSVTCVVVTRDNQLNVSKHSRHYFDLPLSEIATEDGLISLQWSGASRLPMPDGSFDLIHSAYAIENFSDDVELIEGVLFDWDRMLRPGGHAVLTGAHQFRTRFDFRSLLERTAGTLRWRPMCKPRCAVDPNPSSLTLIYQKPAPVH